MADLGKVGITYDKNGYVATTPYEPLTVLKYTNGGTYMSILPTLGHLPTDTNYWVSVVPPITASEIGYTPIAGGVITNTNVQDALEQADSLTQRMRVYGTNLSCATGSNLQLASSQEACGLYTIKFVCDGIFRSVSAVFDGVAITQIGATVTGIGFFVYEGIPYMGNTTTLPITRCTVLVISPTV